MRKVFPLLFVWIFLFTGLCRSQYNDLEGGFELYTTKNNCLDEIVTWSINFPGSISSVTQIRYGNTFYIFFYDRVNGSAFLLDSDLTIARNYYNLSKTIYKIIPDDLDGDGIDELLFYDQFNGKAEICALGSYLELVVKSNIISLRRTWYDILCMDYRGETRNEFLFYDAKDSIANIYKIVKNTDGSYRLDSLWGSVFLKKQTWETLDRVTFENGSKGIIAFDPYNKNSYGKISLFNYSSSPPYFTEIQVNTPYPKNITSIKTGNFGSGREFGNLLFYTRETGDCAFYTMGANNIIPGPTDSTWRNTWDIIVPLKTGDGNDLLFFYETSENKELSMKTYEGSNQAIHPDVIMGHDGKLKMVFTPFPFSDDDIENPSVLESYDGFAFMEIPGTEKPLIKMPAIPPDFRNAYNNDPDLIYDNGKYYMVYNETYSQKQDKFYQNVKMVMYDSNFVRLDSATILKQTSYSRMTFSPSLIKANRYYMFFVSRTPSNKFEISYMSNPELMHGWDNQIKQKAILNAEGNFQPWHINVFRNTFDGMYYMLIAGKFNVASSKNNDLYIARSRDLIKWDIAPEPVLRKENFAHAQFYRSAGLFTDKSTMMIWYSFFEANDMTGMGVISNYYLDTSIFSGGKPVPKKDLVQLSSYPNPFNSLTRINFNVPLNAKITLKLYDVLGREIKRLIDGEFRPAGNYTSYLNAANLSSGIYYAKLFIDGDDDYTNVCKIALIK